MTSRIYNTVSSKPRELNSSERSKLSIEPNRRPSGLAVINVTTDQDEAIRARFDVRFPSGLVLRGFRLCGSHRIAGPLITQTKADSRLDLEGEILRQLAAVTA